MPDIFDQLRSLFSDYERQPSEQLRCRITAIVLDAQHDPLDLATAVDRAGIEAEEARDPAPASVEDVDAILRQRVLAHLARGFFTAPQLQRMAGVPTLDAADRLLESLRRDGLAAALPNPQKPLMPFWRAAT
jgi:hypothetical protein